MGILISKIFGKLIGSKEVAVQARLLRAGCPCAQRTLVAAANPPFPLRSRLRAAAAHHRSVGECGHRCICGSICLHAQWWWEGVLTGALDRFEF